VSTILQWDGFELPKGPSSNWDFPFQLTIPAPFIIARHSPPCPKSRTSLMLLGLAVDSAQPPCHPQGYDHEVALCCTRSLVHRWCPAYSANGLIWGRLLEMHGTGNTRQTAKGISDMVAKSTRSPGRAGCSYDIGEGGGGRGRHPSYVSSLVFPSMDQAPFPWAQSPTSCLGRFPSAGWFTPRSSILHR